MELANSLVRCLGSCQGQKGRSRYGFGRKGLSLSPLYAAAIAFRTRPDLFPASWEQFVLHDQGVVCNCWVYNEKLRVISGRGEDQMSQLTTGAIYTQMAEDVAWRQECAHVTYGNLKTADQ